MSKSISEIIAIREKIKSFGRITLKHENPRRSVGFEVAPSPGLEPGTCGLTVRRSNQLSYEGIRCL